MSSTEREPDTEEEQGKKKKAREQLDDEVPTAPSSPVPQTETPAVNEVTEGVREVELEDREKEADEKDENPEEEAKPETVPLPAETAGELDIPDTPLLEDSESTEIIPGLSVKVDDVKSTEDSKSSGQAVETGDTSSNTDKEEQPSNDTTDALKSEK